MCVPVCVFYMHSTSFTIFGHRAASSSLVPAMSVHISHNALRTASCHTPCRLLPYSAVVTHAQRQFRFQFRMLSMRRGSAKKVKKREETQHKRKTSKSCWQSLNNISLLEPYWAYVASLGPPEPWPPPTPFTLFLLLFLFLFFVLVLRMCLEINKYVDGLRVCLCVCLSVCRCRQLTAEAI